MTNPFADLPTAPAQASSPPRQPTAPTAITTAPGQSGVKLDPFGGIDPFEVADPAPPAPRGPRLRDLYGRLLIIIPKKVETVPNRLGKPGETQQRMIADVVVLSGDDNGNMIIAYGGRPEDIPPVPHNKQVTVPHKFDDMFISSVGLISQCREALERRRQGKPGMVIGRLSKGEDTGKGNPPWILQKATEADKEIGRAYLASVDPFSLTG